MTVHLRRIGLVLSVVLVIAGVAVVVQRRSRHDWPDRWDARVLPYVRFVERERGLTFRHPVATDFLADTAFEHQIGRSTTLSADDVKKLHQDEGIFRALGLMSGDVDLRKAAEQVTKEEIIGLYDPDTRHVYVRGDRITPGMRPTIVHELTHALQAQHFDIDPTLTTGSAATAFRALVEADAMRVEDAYVRSLSEDDKRAVDEEQQKERDAVDLQGVPPILTELFTFPYALGPAFEAALVHDGGLARVNHAFHDRPVTEQQIVQPSTFLAGGKPVAVGAPKLRDGETATGDPDDFGMVSLLLVLGQRVPFPTAWEAVKDWRGDNSVTYRAGGHDCIRVDVELSSESAAARLLAASRTWAAGRDSATVAESGRQVELASCDPGTGSTPDAAGPRPFDLLQLRAEIITAMLDGGLSESDAECTADAVIRDHDPAKLLDVAKLDDEHDPRVADLQHDITDAVTQCRSRSTS